MTVAQQIEARTAHRLRGDDVGVPVRALGQAYDEDIPDFWFRDNALLSLFFTGFSATLPDGEAQFIYSVRLFEKKITDPVLKAQVKAFIGQEGHHSREHEAFNRAMLKRGYPMDRIEARIARINAWSRKYQSPEKQLAFTVCGEHLTALMADYFITRRRDLFDDMHPKMARIWGWHAIEETEHKSVAFDVYDQLVGDRNLLRRTMVELTVIFLTLNTFEALNMVRKTDQRFSLKMWRQGIAFLRQMRKDLSADYLDFYKPDYHPWQHDNRASLNWARQLFF